MNASVPAEFRARLYRVAVDFAVSEHAARVADAVVLAEDLVASGFVGEATVEVAVLRRDATYSDAGPLVHSMLGECGIDLPPAHDEDDSYRLFLGAFGFWDLPVGDFYGPFLDRLPPWDDRVSLDRALMGQFLELDDATEPARADEIVERMRTSVRDALGEVPGRR